MKEYTKRPNEHYTYWIYEFVCITAKFASSIFRNQLPNALNINVFQVKLQLINLIKIMGNFNENNIKLYMLQIFDFILPYL